APELHAKLLISAPAAPHSSHDRLIPSASACRAGATPSQSPTTISAAISRYPRADHPRVGSRCALHERNGGHMRASSFREMRSNQRRGEARTTLAGYVSRKTGADRQLERRLIHQVGLIFTSVGSRACSSNGFRRWIGPEGEKRRSAEMPWLERGRRLARGFGR